MHRYERKGVLIGCEDEIVCGGEQEGEWHLVFFFNDTATTEIYTLSLHDALPICQLLCFWSLVTLVVSGDQHGCYHLLH